MPTLGYSQYNVWTAEERDRFVEDLTRTYTTPRDLFLQGWPPESPDLRGRALYTNASVGPAPGAGAVTLTREQLPAHTQELTGYTADYVIVDEAAPYFIKNRDIRAAVEHYRNEFETELLEPVKFTLRAPDHIGDVTLVVEVKATATGLRGAFGLYLENGGVYARDLRLGMEQLCQSMVQKSLEVEQQHADYSVVEERVARYAREQSLYNLHNTARWVGYDDMFEWNPYSIRI